ncbi:Glycosyltransferase involved in cell wall bisynthesis [Prosthecobacter debontii]|uniref:Glycosyltransferase involved in cell wall bisynthesis n=1 Tax=Prosthecobacter debontii TaxID=48467 RepID=A0A1T4YVP4_9BACT|nr:Glycosyltransferase involved in cell wall bisynthesis [Prosthecobacter debontii]
MRILVITDPVIPVPPIDYGGVERIAASLCQCLRDMGHVVDLIAGPGSQSFGGRLFIHHRPSTKRLSRAARKAWFQGISAAAVLKADCVINFGRLDYLHLILKLAKPLICCFQNPILASEVEWLVARRSRNLALVGISRAQVEDVRHLAEFSVIYNSTNTDLFEARSGIPEEGYFVFLGRLTANKGVDTAIRVAKKCGVRLKIAGNRPQEEDGLRYFNEEIKPHLGDVIEYVGEINDEQKKSLLGNARALLFPIRWPEPFGIVMVESLACGTPVIATRCASTPEVIDHGKTGFLAESEDEMVEAVQKIDSVDRLECRRQAEQRFSSKVMTEKYLDVIQKLVASHSA